MSEPYITRKEHEEFERRLLDEEHRQNTRLGLLEDSFKQIHALAISVEKMAVNMEHMLNEQMRQGKRLEILEDEPQKSWNALKYGILGAIAAAIGSGIVAIMTKFM